MVTDFTEAVFFALVVLLIVVGHLSKAKLPTQITLFAAVGRWRELRYALHGAGFKVERMPYLCGVVKEETERRRGCSVGGSGPRR